MPEGDTIHKLAARLRPPLEGARIEALRLRERGLAGRVTGKRIEEVSALGKNLLVGIESKWIVRVHLGLNGRVRTYEPEWTWQSRVREATLVLETDRIVVASFRTMRAGLHRKGDMLLERQLAGLGPDLLAPSIDLDSVLRTARLPGYADRPLVDVLLDQRIAAGIGNVYKSEVLFLAGVHPRTRTGDLEDAKLRELFTRARELMKSNLGEGPRVTLGPRRGRRRQPGTPTVFVYRRAALPCFRCKTPIERILAGADGRSTYFCPHCQRPSPSRCGPGD